MATPKHYNERTTPRTITRPHPSKKCYRRHFKREVWLKFARDYVAQEAKGRRGQGWLEVPWHPEGAEENCQKGKRHSTQGQNQQGADERDDFRAAITDQP
jgi:hypothetical protein